MKLEKMTAKNLQKWVLKLYKVIEEEKDPVNISIYTKWLKEAQNEQDQREHRRLQYLRGGYNGKKDKTRCIY